MPESDINIVNGKYMLNGKLMKSKLRKALEFQCRENCVPPLSDNKMEDMSNDYLSYYINEHKKPQPTLFDNKKDKPVFEHKFTLVILHEIQNAKTIPVLAGIYNKYPKLHKDKNFINQLSYRKQEIKNKEKHHA